jgi:uncharacterized NAD-dependent epimerase/dehydratase family protein
MTESSSSRRYVILAEGRFEDRNAKTAHGLIAYGRKDAEVAAVIDSALAGRRVLDVMPSLRRDAPIVGTLGEALRYSPDSILVGLAPAGGRLPEPWIGILRDAAEAGLEIVSGLHQRLAPMFPGANVWDVREPPENIPLFSGECFDVQPKVALTVGTNTAIGKMTTTLEIGLAAQKRGFAVEFVPTGQTGIVIAGWGICIDAVVSDFVAGASEQLVLEAAKRDPELIMVEGQGSLGHPAYSGVTTALLHGSCPDCLVLCADASLEKVFTRIPVPDLNEIIDLYEGVAALVKPAQVVAVSVNTEGLDEGTARAFVEGVAATTGLPTVDPVRSSADLILDAVLRAPKTAEVGT